MVFSTRSGNKIVVNKQKIAIMTFVNFEKRPFLCKNTRKRRFFEIGKSHYCYLLFVKDNLIAGSCTEDHLVTYLGCLQIFIE